MLQVYCCSFHTNLGSKWQVGSYLVLEAAGPELELSVGVPGTARPPQPAGEFEVPMMSRVIMK